jgi:hypothetical protein
MSRTRYRFGDNRQPHFLTCTIVTWLPVLTRPGAVQIVLDSWRFLQHENRWTLGIRDLGNEIACLQEVLKSTKHPGVKWRAGKPRARQKTSPVECPGCIKNAYRA